MKSPDFAERFSFIKFLTVLLSLLLVVFVSSCDNDQTGQQTIELPSGQDITQTIATQFESSEDVPADEITVSTADGVVTLSGTLTNLLAKHKAEEIAKATFGVLSVVNNLRIASTRPDEQNTEGINTVVNNISVERKVVVTPGIPITDEAIRARARTALIRDPYIDQIESIDITVSDGIVRFSGTVDSQYNKDRIESIAQDVKGIIAINNDIRVEPSNES